MAYPWERERPEPPTQPYEAEAPWEFSEEEIAAMSAVRDRVLDGQGEVFTDDQEAKRLEFARWLVEHGKLTED